MNLSFFIANRISGPQGKTYGKLAIYIAAAGITLSVGIMLLSLSIIRGFKGTITDKLSGFMGDVQITAADYGSVFESSAIPEDLLLRKRLTAGLDTRYIFSFACKPVIATANNETEGVTFKGVTKDYDSDFIAQLTQQVTTAEARKNEGKLTSNRNILISSWLATRLKLSVGDNLTLYFIQQPPKRRKFTVSGIYDTGIEQIDKGFIIGDIENVRQVNNWPADYIGGYEVKFSGKVADSIAENSVAALLPSTLKAQSISTLFPGLISWLNVLDTNTNVIITLMLLVGAINMITALLIIILEKTSFVGMLKAMGARNWLIMKVFLIEGVYIIIAGLLLGNIAGVGLAWLQDITHAVKLDQGSYFMAYVPIDLRWSDVLWINIGTLFTCFLALLLPAIYITRISPLKAIRFK